MDNELAAPVVALMGGITNGPLREWFAAYCRGFLTADPEEQRNYDLKELHTYNVCANMAILAQAHGLKGERFAAAQTIALFHDLGRFRQYQLHRTFKDSDSVNHAALGAQLLQESGVLTGFSPADRELIIQAVRLHNVFALPAKLHPDGRLFLHLVRDADKLDIWQVFIDYYHLPVEERASAVGLGFPDLPSCSPEVVATLCRRQMVQLAQVKTLNDFKLLQLSWVFDLNFAESFRLFVERDYLEQLAGLLPSEPAVAAAVEAVRDFARSMTAQACLTGTTG